MELIEKKFVKSGCLFLNGEWSPVQRTGEAIICNESLREIFAIPDDCLTVWLSLHSRPAANRLSVTILRDSYNDPVIKTTELGYSAATYIEFDFGSLYSVLQKHIGKTLYVECRYES